MLLKSYLICVLTVSVITAIVFAWDKHASKREGKARVPEIVLLSFTAAGGGPGGLFGMYALRHKTNFSTKFHFALTVWISLVLQTALGVFIYLTESGVVSI